MSEIEVSKIKNLKNNIKLNLKSDGYIKKPVLYVKSRKELSCSFRMLPNQLSDRKVTFLIPAMKLSPTNLYYDIYLEFIDKDGESRQERVRTKSKLQRRLVNLLNLKHQLVRHEDKSYLITGYFAVGGYLAFQVRETDQYDSLKYRMKELLACVLVPFVYSYYKDSKLIYEKFSNYARDNSFYYFAYVQNNMQDNKLFYVITKDSPDIENLKPYLKNTVYFMSVKHLMLIMVAKYFIASESKGHAYAWRHNQSIARYCLNRKPFVFLQHGVLGLKQVDKTFFANNRLNHANLFITSSKIEKKIVLNFLGYQEQNVAITGLARWDNFKKLPKEKKMFVMPTWRVNLELLSDGEFLKSEFYRSYYSLLHSNKIKHLLYENGYTLHFMLHPKFVRFEKYFVSDDKNIKVVRQSDIPIDFELKTSKLVITDYSSIMWDALYYGCPALLFQFDQAEYLQTQGSYLDFHSDLKEIIVKDPQTLLNKIATFMQNQETIDLSSLQHKFFAYSDRSNSKRIGDSISQWENDYQFVPLYKKYLTRFKR
ncbi:CDP-glycerol glycerophosphotransferase family protein [Ligilactobacillus acidipiscis]|uniref:CDP-glycerol glycerophosphotransferase family protein n=1 Tax=Ligilactobacillus acidipiscis TaxID=89059 RepID=UPI00386D4304